MDEFDAMLARELQDPAFRLWWYWMAPRFWVEDQLLRILFWVRDAAQTLAMRMMDVYPVEYEDKCDCDCD